jgi:hypothetical protein
LNRVVDLDLEAERALVQIGELERSQRFEEAARLVDERAILAEDRAIDAAKGVEPESVWGRARKDELVATMTERRDELPRYAAALRARDLEQELASVEKQLAIEKRAMTIAQAIKDGAEANP